MVSLILNSKINVYLKKYILIKTDEFLIDIKKKFYNKRNFIIFKACYDSEEQLKEYLRPLLPVI